MKWFKHETNANTDAKIKKIKNKYGMSCYGLYWYCIELIAGKIDSKNITFELDEDAGTIAKEWKMEQSTVQEMMEYMCEIGLFDSNNGAIVCMKLAKYIDEYSAKNPEIKLLVSKLFGSAAETQVKSLPNKPKKAPEQNLNAQTVNEENAEDERQADLFPLLHGGRPPKPQSKSCDIVEIFEYWVEKMNKNQNTTKLTDERRRKIRSRLKSHSVEFIKTAIRNVSTKKWEMSSPARHDIAVICRSDTKLQNHFDDDSVDLPGLVKLDPKHQTKTRDRSIAQQINDRSWAEGNNS